MNNDTKMKIITILWLTAFFALWFSYECWRFGTLFGICICGQPHAVILGAISGVCIAIGLWLAGPIKIPPP